MPRALVFDLDGLLIDSENPGFRITREIVHRHATADGPAVSRAEYGQLVGVAVHETWKTLRRRYRLAPSLEELLAEHEQAMLACYRSATLMPGAAELVASARELGLTLGIASSAPGPFVEAAAQALSIGRHFAALVSADHPLVMAPKPAPDVYAVACELLGVRPSLAIAIEDSPSGARAALAAGLRTIVVVNEWTQDRPFPQEVVMMDDLLEVRDALCNQSRFVA
jgi:putative hydrolase of the HAD superfamily